MLKMQGIRKAFGATVALDGVSLTVDTGEVLALVGENGAGKSTLMKVLSGALRPDEGEMVLAGDVYRPAHPGEARDLGVGMIYQELSLAPHLSVCENIFLGRECTEKGWLRKKEMREVALSVMLQAGLSGMDPDVRAARLSNAQAQQVEIARALASGCRVLVLDEPTSSLSNEEIETLFALIREWKAAGMAVIYISHFLEEVREIADRCTVLCDGRAVLTSAMDSISNSEIVKAMVGREIKELYPRSERKQGEEVLRYESDRGGFVLHRGEILGISGIIGSGRTELLEEIFGLRDPGPGVLSLRGVSGFGRPAARWKQGMGMLSEDRKRQGLALSLSVADNLTLTRLPGWSRPVEREDMARKWIRRLGIKCAAADVKMLSLSGGNQQKVAVARLLHHDADVWLLDEPTRGIDVAAKANIYELLDQLVAPEDDSQKPCAVLMVSSYLPELLGICDRVAVMRRGRLEAARPVEEWNEHLLMQEAIR